MENTRLGNKYIVYDFKDESKLIQKKVFDLSTITLFKEAGRMNLNFRKGGSQVRTGMVVR